MRWHAQNVKDMHTALDPLPVDSTATSRDEKFQRIEAIASAAGCSIARLRHGYSTTEAVTYSDQLHASKESVLSTLFVWRLCSGFAHGRPWASLGFLEREEIETDDPEILHARMTSDLPRALMAPQHALELCNRLVRLYEQRCTPIGP